MSTLFRLLSHLPLAVLHNLGALLGTLVYWASPTYRRHLRENTALAGPWAVAVRAQAAREAGKGLLELPWVWLRPQEELVAQVVKVSGWQHIEAAWAADQGILFITPHLGCFEIIAQYYASHRPLSVLYRPPRQAWLRPIVEQGRGAHLQLAPADLGGVRTLIKTLRNRQAVGMLPDQVPGNGEGMWAPFFGRPAYTMTLAARLAGGTAALIFAHAERLPYGAGYHVVFQSLAEVLAEPLATSLEARTVQLNRAIEALIRACPEQYLWGYNRYKTPAGVTPPTATDLAACQKGAADA